jgi:hypothetical protein
VVIESDTFGFTGGLPREDNLDLTDADVTPFLHAMTCFGFGGF